MRHTKLVYIIALTLVFIAVSAQTQQRVTLGQQLVIWENKFHKERTRANELAFMLGNVNMALNIETSRPLIGQVDQFLIGQGYAHLARMPSPIVVEEEEKAEGPVKTDTTKVEETKP